MKKHLIFQVILFIIFYSLADIIFAKASLGEVAGNISSVMSGLANIFYQVCFILGGCFIFAGIIKYVEHRTNPLMVTWSMIFFLFIAGIIFILIPLAAYFASDLVPFN